MGEKALVRDLIELLNTRDDPMTAEDIAFNLRMAGHSMITAQAISPVLGNLCGRRQLIASPGPDGWAVYTRPEA